MSDPLSLAEALPAQQKRVRDVLEHYHEAQRMGGGRVDCRFAIMTINASLENAEKAAASGDVVEMLWAYNDLKEIE
jgi:hypothetical protein